MKMSRVTEQDKQQRNRETDKAEIILDAALSLFSERGFDGTPVPMIAERAGVGAGTIYRYFENKEALVNALFQKWKIIFLTELAENFPASASPREQFSFIWNALFDFQKRHPLVLSFLEFNNHAPYLDERSEELSRELLGFMENFIAENQRAGVLRESPDAKALLSLTQGGFLGLVKAAGFGEIELTAELIRETEETCWRAMAR